MMILIEILHIVDYILEQVVIGETGSGSRFSIVVASGRVLRSLIRVAMDGSLCMSLVGTI